MQEKYKCAVRIMDEENDQVRISIIGADKATVLLVQKKLHVLKVEYPMDQKFLAFVIGKTGERIRTIIENSQLIKIDFDKRSTSNTDKICLL